MERKGRWFRRGVSLALCLSLLLPLLGCGKEAEPSSEPSAETAATEAVRETWTDPVEAALSAAQADMDREDYDSAAEILEQAMEDSADLRLTNLLDQVETLASVPLEVAVSQDASALKTGTAEIRSVTAVQRRDGAVRFSVEYTADSDMHFLFQGAGLDYTSTSPMTGSLTFELSTSDLRAMGNTFQMFLGHSQGDSVYAQLYVTLPGDGSTLAAPFTLRQGEASGTGAINSITGQVVDDDLIFCSMIYTAPKPGMELYLRMGDGEPVLINWTDSGKRENSFYVRRSALKSGEEACVILTSSLSSDRYVSAYFSPEELAVPEGFQTGVLREVQDIPFGANDSPYQVGSISAQVLQSEMVLFRVPFTAPEGVTEVEPWGGHAFVDGMNKTYPSLEDGNLGPSDTLRFYVPLEDLQKTEEILAEFGIANDPEPCGITISNAWYRDTTEGTPVGDPVELEFKVSEVPTVGEYSFQSCTAQRLNNGYVRLRLDYTAPAHCEAHLMNENRSYDVNCSSGSADGPQLAVVDIPAEAPLKSGNLGFRCNWLRMMTEGLLYVDIDVSPFFGGDAAQTAAIALREIAL